jgi:hypothetical protein
MRRKIGDVYRIRLNDGQYALMQHLCNDTSQLNSPIVVVSLKRYQASEEIKAEQIMDHDSFFVHVLPKAGETLCVWERVQWLRPLIDKIPVIWATCNHRDLQLEVSRDWSVWRTNEKWRSPASQNELMASELGLVMNPLDIVHRIEHGAYAMKYPLKEYN